MKQKGRLLLSLFLIIWFVFAGTLLINQGQHFIGKSFFESSDFQSKALDFKNKLGKYVLAPFDAEKAKEQIVVTQEEIENYRSYYGTLTEQIENIRWQYSERIVIAEQENNEELKTLLVEERDSKIADIKENFTNDEHVEKKIHQQKERLIDEFAAQEERQRKDFLNQYQYFNYSFTNAETGEKFESGVRGSSDIYIETFGQKNTHFKVDTTTYLDPYHLEVEEQYIINGIHIGGNVSHFEGSISIPKSSLSTTDFKVQYQSFSQSKMVHYIIWITGILALIGLFTIAKPKIEHFNISSRAKEIFLNWPVDIRIVMTFIIAMGTHLMMETIGYELHHAYYWMPSVSRLVIYFVLMFVFGIGTIFGALWTWESIKTEEQFKKELKGSFIYRLTEGMQDLFLNRSIGTQSLAILVVVFLSGVGIVGAMVSGELLLIYTPLFFFIALPSGLIFLRRMGYLNRIMKQTEDMAKGRLTNDIKVKGKSQFAQHAKNLNELREGVKQSISEQAKSERLKTELITNVSHDLRTPLTSIITYTDLLKNPNITEEERNQYIEILDKKSARLKTLIEDLFEVSKMASGNIEINKQRIDLTQLMQQAIGEHEESFKDANLDLRITMPEQSIYAYVDGQKWWRVLDNLIVNALKYSLNGTRVYITLKQVGAEAEFTFKNVTKYELSENVEELTERFKRADASRHTDGSGLGLAIAQSIVDLHNGRLNIEVDGDLFKVTVKVTSEL